MVEIKKNNSNLKGNLNIENIIVKSKNESKTYNVDRLYKPKNNLLNNRYQKGDD